MPADKEFSTTIQQINGLKARNLKFHNEKKAYQLLKKYNYFDVINGFESILLDKATPKNYTDIYFEDFIELYTFDMKLKVHTLSKIFDFESHLRTSISYNFCNAHCTTLPDTLNYTKKIYYNNPDPTNKYLINKFREFELFKKTYIDSSGKKVPGFIDTLKNKKDYAKSYCHPPFWIAIKSLPLGSLYFTFVFLESSIKSSVLKDFDSTDTNAFIQSIHILKEMRNQCAHLELISRFSLIRSANLNNYSDITRIAKLSATKKLNYMDVLKILKLYGSIWSLKKEIINFYIHMMLHGRKKIAIKVLGKMGNQNIFKWMSL